MSPTIKRWPMPKCGVCGWSFTGWALTKHAETPCGEEDSKAPVRTYAPEKTINDIKREGEESE
jgi:hypothetical protein